MRYGVKKELATDVIIKNICGVGAINKFDTFEGLSSYNSRHLAFLEEYSSTHFLPIVHDEIIECIEIVDEWMIEAKIGQKAREYLETAIKFIPQDALIKFLEEEHERLGDTEFYEYYYLK